MGLVNIYYQTMLDNHPWFDGLMDLIDGPIKKFHQDPKYHNTCASQVSYAFNCIDGHFIDTSGDWGKGGMLVKSVRTLKDNDGFEYIFSILDMRQYLNNRYGAGQMLDGTSKLKDRNGVIIFNPTHVNADNGKMPDGHNDIWVNGQIDNPGLFDSTWYGHVKQNTVFFWDLNP